MMCLENWKNEDQNKYITTGGRIMACGGCGGARRVQSQPVITQRQAVPRAPMVQRAMSTSQTPTQRAIGGVRAQQPRRCQKCGWPMNSMRRYEPSSGRQIQVFACMNRKCLHKEEIR